MGRRSTGSSVGFVTVVGFGLVLSSGCVARDIGDELIDDAGDDDVVETPVPPEESGGGGGGGTGLFAACESVSECGAHDYCLKIKGELGFCTESCESQAELDECRALSGLDVACQPVGGERVCVLDCSQSKCPIGMTCERVEVDGNPEKICF